MLYIDVKGVIDNEETKAWMELWGGTGNIFTVESLRKVLADNPNEREITLNLDCDGGSVEEGFKIYDELRMSGRIIYANIAGSCHSMTVVVLLAAPEENRSGNKNLRSMIHPVSGGICGIVTADDCQRMADELSMEEEAILDIYEERTGQPREVLEELMRNSTMCDAETLLKHNFISKINSYNTNQFFNIMSNPIKSAYDAFMSRRNAYRKRNEEPTVYEYKDAEGNVVFTSEVAPEVLAEGDAVTLTDGGTSGTFTLDDGREVVVTDNVVESISTSDDQTLKERVTELEAMLDDATNLATSQQAEIINLQNQLAKYTGSDHKPAGNHRSSVPVKKNVAAGDNRSVADIKEQSREVRKKVNEGKSIVKKN